MISVSLEKNTVDQSMKSMFVREWLCFVEKNKSKWSLDVFNILLCFIKELLNYSHRDIYLVKMQLC